MVPGSIFVHTRVEEVEHLCSVLDRSFGLPSTIQLDRGKPRIYIRKGYLDRFRSLVLPYFHKSILYKLP
jgi:hypothetical protein